MCTKILFDTVKIFFHTIIFKLVIMMSKLSIKIGHYEIIIITLSEYCDMICSYLLAISSFLGYLILELQ